MSESDHFARLGLPRSYAVDLRELERNYLTRSRALHPDFHQFGSSSEQSASLEGAARLNEAYAALRDPLSRAEYLLRVHGGPSAADQKEMPAEFLEEMLQLRMEIEELRDTEAADSPARLSMEKRLIEKKEAILGAVADDFAKVELDSNRDAVLRSLRRHLNSLKYVQNLLRDLQS